MTLTSEDKIKIVARNFYIDNEGTDGAFDSYDQAVKEMTKVSPRFIDSCIKTFPLKAESGYRLLMKDGYVIQVNNETGHVLPISDIKEDYGNNIQKDFEKESEKHPESVTAIVILQNIGWKLI